MMIKSQLWSVSVALNGEHSFMVCDWHALIYFLHQSVKNECGTEYCDDTDSKKWNRRVKTNSKRKTTHIPHPILNLLI